MSFPAEKNAEFGEDTPLGRPGQPGELAPLYVFVATEDSQYISGEVIGATGGKPLHLNLPLRHRCTVRHCTST